jgi:hypothetical protein
MIGVVTLGSASSAVGMMVAASLLGPVQAQPAAAPAAGLPALLPRTAVPVQQEPTPDAPMEVTTDTPEYCVQLADKVHTLASDAVVKPPREVSDLSAEGQRMCAHGQTRPGIMRLRRAIMLMKHEDAGPTH